ITETRGLVAVLTNVGDTQPKLGGSYFNTTTKNFAPRISAAWDPRGDGKMPIRAGFGLYDLLSFPYLMENRTNSFPYFEEGTVDSPPASAFPTGGLALITPSTLRASYVQQNPARAYSMQYNVIVQREIMANAALTVGYVGSQGRHLPRSVED